MGKNPDVDIFMEASTHVNKQQPLNKNFSNQSSRHQSSEHKSTHSSSIFSPSNNSRESNSQRTSGKNSPNGSQNSSSGIVHNGQGSQLTSNNSNSINSNNMNHNQFLPSECCNLSRARCLTKPQDAMQCKAWRSCCMITRACYDGINLSAACGHRKSIRACNNSPCTIKALQVEIIVRDTRVDSVASDPNYVQPTITFLFDTVQLVMRRRLAVSRAARRTIVVAEAIPGVPAVISGVHRRPVEHPRFRSIVVDYADPWVEGHGGIRILVAKCTSSPGWRVSTCTIAHFCATVRAH